jgi:hypothetical protein
VGAAEHRRRRGSTEGFAAVARMADELAVERGKDKELVLLRLFQPDPATRGLFTLMMGFMKKGALGGALRAPLAFPAGALAAALILAVGLVLWLAGVGFWVVMLALALAIVAKVGGLAWSIWRAVGRLPANGFGLCTLGPGSVGDKDGLPALTTWLHEKLQAIVHGEGATDADPVVTFADLWGIDRALEGPERIEALRAASRDGAAREVDLQMMTTDLTHGRPLRLPSPYQRYAARLEHGGGALFRISELERYFPRPVMEHLKAWGEPISPDIVALLPDGGADFRRFPMGPDLPVVVATRMSLSFPGLISAVPLWDVDHSDAEHPRLERVVFSDGGIASNFPVHFFDAPLPQRPTFGLHLTVFPEGVKPPVGIGNQASAIEPPPEDVTLPAPGEPRDMRTLPQLFGAIVDAMQNWRDNVQAAQPGFRDRMVHIRLGDGEGGMTLNMRRGKVLDLSDRGAEAAKVLIARFADAGAGARTPWNNHRYVRFRITMGVTEDFLAGFSAAWSPPGGPPADGITMAYPARVDDATTKPYALTDVQLRRAREAAARYDRPLPEVLAQQLSSKAPRPPSVLRTVPPV